MSESITAYIYVYALIGILTHLCVLYNFIIWFIDKYIFKYSERAEKEMIHDLITDCEDYKHSDCDEKAGDKNV